MPSALLTTEFLIDFTIPQEWLDTLKRIWNEGLFYLRWRQHYQRAVKCNALDLPPVEIKCKKLGDDYVYFCDIGRDFRIDKNRSWDKSNIEFRLCVTLVNPKWKEIPPINSFNSFELKKPFAKSRCDWIKQSGLPTVYLNDFTEMTLYPAWESYVKGVRGKPNYKRKTDKINTIVCASLRTQCRYLGNEKFKIPGATITVPNIEQRLLKPIAKLVEGMRAHPEKYPSLGAKFKKIKSLETTKLIKSDGKERKNLKPEEIEKYTSQVDNQKAFEKAIEFFSSPGGFKLLSREGKTYIQFWAEMPVNNKSSDKSVGVDTGLDLLVDATSGLRVEHQNFTKELARIDLLNQKLSKMKHGSNNYNKLLDKIRKIHGNIKRSKRARQHYFAQQLADVNGSIAIKEIPIKEAIENPAPIVNKDGKYIPNGRKEATIKNRELSDCAIGQFVALLSAQCQKKGRAFSKIEIEAEATPQEVLEIADFPPVGATSETAQNSLSSDGGTREGERVTAPTITGKGKPTSNNQYQYSQQVKSAANPPTKNETHKGRKTKKEKAIG